MIKTKEQAVETAKTAIQQLDDASGAIYNALYNLEQLKRAHLLPGRIQNLIDRLDIPLIDIIKNDLEEYIEGAE